MKFFRSLLNFFAVILMIVMFAWMLISCVCNVVFRVVTPNGITALVKEVDFTTALVDESGQKTEIYQFLIDESGMREEDVYGLLNSDSFKNIVGELFGSVIYYSFTGDEGCKISSGELNTMVRENIDTIIKEADITLTTVEKNRLVEALTSNSGELTTKLYSEIDVVNDSMDIKMLLNNYLVVIIVVSVFLFLLIALFRWSFIQAVSDVGVVILAAGIIILLLGVFSRAKFVLDLLLNVPFEASNLLRSVIYFFGNLLVVNGVIMIMVGILLIVLVIIIRKIIEKRKIMISKGVNDNKDMDLGVIEQVQGKLEGEVVEEPTKVNEETMEMKTFAEKIDK